MTKAQEKRGNSNKIGKYLFEIFPLFARLHLNYFTLFSSSSQSTSWQEQQKYEWKLQKVGEKSVSPSRNSENVRIFLKNKKRIANFVEWQRKVRFCCLIFPLQITSLDFRFQFSDIRKNFFVLRQRPTFVIFDSSHEHYIHSIFLINKLNRNGLNDLHILPTSLLSLNHTRESKSHWRREKLL